MSFPIPSHLPRQIDMSSQILSKLDSVTFQSLDSAVASSWLVELDESIRATKVRSSRELSRRQLNCDEQKRIHDRIHANFPAFETQLNSARSAQRQLQGLERDVDTLKHSVSDPEV